MKSARIQADDVRPREPEFVLDPADKVYVRPHRAPFAYSDGDEVERRIYRTLAAAADVSTKSAELQSAIADWATEYHFSTARHNLLRHLSITSEHAILEVGAGCGSITRLLGETGARVVAVEGSLVRARCARLRCRELANVEVYCSNLQDFHHESSFDVVTLIGVLEYAPLYISGENPMLACLELAKRHLKPGGVLIVAIENQLGLKYFCGYPEDHVSVPYFGIKDLYSTRTVRTLGRAELSGLFQEAGFQHTEIHYPFPDYKLPCVVFLERAFATPGFRPEEIIRQLRSRDYTGVSRPLVPDSLVWPVLGRNGLIRDLSNSFLAFATTSGGNPLAPPPGLLAVGYTNDRAPAYNTTTRFVADGNGQVWVTRTLAAPPPTALLTHSSGPELYVEGKHLGAEMEKCIEADDLQAFADYFRRWTAFLLGRSAHGTETEWALETELAAEYVDCIPKNVILRGANLHYIDREWTLHHKLLAGTVVLRYLVTLRADNAGEFFARHLCSGRRTNVLPSVVRYFGLNITDAVVQNYVEVSNIITAAVYPGKRTIGPRDVWALLTSANPEPGMDASDKDWYRHAYWRLRKRMRRKT